ncbi:MAG: phosphosulfolactate synthase [Halanaerobiaceae bacterium]
MTGRVNNCWGMDLEVPFSRWEGQPDGSEGLTMVLDKGMGAARLRDMLEIAGDYMDFLKLSFGTSFLYPEYVLEKKIYLAKKFDVYIYPGGTLFEIAVFHQRMKEYLIQTKKLGFTAVEVSSGTIETGEEMRKEAVKMAKSLGLKVLTEVGKKSREESLSSEEFIDQIIKDGESGADYIIVEGRESGCGISIYDQDGGIRLNKFKSILTKLSSYRGNIIWETPLKKQQIFFLRNLGMEVNLGNIAPDEVLALAALRRGLRGDTFRDILIQTEGENY